MIHKTRPVWVLVDIDLEIADFVEYLNTIPGVRTHASCQGTLGEGGPAPYRAQVLVSWDIPEARDLLISAFEVTIPEDCDGTWFYVHPPSSKTRMATDAEARDVADKVFTQHSNLMRKLED